MKDDALKVVALFEEAIVLLQLNFFRKTGIFGLTAYRDFAIGLFIITQALLLGDSFRVHFHS